MISFLARTLDSTKDASSTAGNELFMDYCKVRKILHEVMNTVTKNIVTKIVEFATTNSN